MANPPPDFGPLAFVALVPVLWFIRGSRPRRGAWCGFAFGLTYYGILMYWLLPFGVIAWFPLVLSQAGYAALFGGLAPLLWGRPSIGPGRAGRWGASPGAASDIRSTPIRSWCLSRRSPACGA